MSETTTTVRIDENGRCVIPKAARERLGFDGQEVTAEVTVRYNDA